MKKINKIFKIKTIEEMNKLKEHDNMEIIKNKNNENINLNEEKISEEEDSIEVLTSEFESNKCDSFKHKYDKKCNNFILKKELIERNEIKNNPEDNDFLYPTLNDPNFIIKIAEKKEFNDTKYDGKIYDIKEQAEILANADFELAPQQAFVRNFLSFQTPYSSLLLYHGLGSGKTASAIGVCEEHRDYLKQFGITKQIIIVASPNVQDNFRLQMFDERRLKLIDGLWNLKGATGNKFLKEINPMNMKGLTKEKVISNVNSIIKLSYLFMGYIEFSNYIENIKSVKGIFKDENDRHIKMVRNLKYEFDDTLIVIDEIHNIRVSEENKNKKVALQLLDLVKSASNLRLLLLSATPMYNSYKEIIWLLNLMNLNDRRATIEIKDVFDKDGNFKKSIDGKEEGKELLIRKATGYISFVRGENPYTFPFRIYPYIFSPELTLDKISYPKYQMNKKLIKDGISILNPIIYLTNIGKYQSMGYTFIINNLINRNFSTTTKTGIIREMPNFEVMDSFNYTLLQIPLEALNIIYPIENEGLENIISKLNEQNKNKNNSEMVVGGVGSSSTKSSQNLDINININISANDLTGKKGLERVMDFIDTKTPPEKGSFEYKKWLLDKNERIFSPNKIGNYSSKIKSICSNIIPENGQSSDGIVLIYSQYIDGGLVPLALALEEMGFSRYGNKSLFKTPPTKLIDSKTLKPRENKENFTAAKYIMITGDPRISPNNDDEIKAVTNDNNKDGHNIKVILISQAGSEGVDFKFVRQVHIIDPWYNMNRIEQIIGRAVRNLSHKVLDFEKRNVQIFIYGTLLENHEEEAADLYIYRTAEYKAIQMGKVSRVLKETSVDCLINHDQINFTQENIEKETTKKVKQQLSNGIILNDFKVGDIPYSASCDYMANCEYKCYPDKNIDDKNTRLETYNESFIINNSEKIFQKIRYLFSDKTTGKFFFKKNEFIRLINIPKKYQIVQIYAALTQLIEDKTEFIIDKYGRTGHLINIGDYYLFQPSELNSKLSIYDRSVPLDFKHNMIKFEMKTNINSNNLDGSPIIDEVEPEELTGEQVIELPKIMVELKSNFDLTQSFINTDENVPKADDNWYKHCGITIRKLINNKIMTHNDANEFLIEHLVDTLQYKEKVQLLNYIYKITTFKENTFNYFIKSYLDKKIIKTKKLTSIILFSGIKNDILSIMIFENKNKTWKVAEPEDEREITFEVNKMDFNNNELNSPIGFIGLERQNKFLTFKVKYTGSKQNKGARCDEASKTKNIEIIIYLLGEEKFKIYSQENIKNLNKSELCSLQELLFRYYNKIKKDNKIWFLDYETLMLSTSTFGKG